MTNLEQITAFENEDPVLALGSRLAVVRSETKMTQAEFAATLNISARAYHLYECGKRSMPAPVLMQVSKLYTVDMNWLMLGLGTAKLMENHSDETKEFVLSLLRYLDRTETKLKNESLAALISSWINRLLKGEKVDIASVDYSIDVLKTQP